MSKKPMPWWAIPGMVTGAFAALGVLGTVAINYATYAALPKKVEAAEQRNQEQDKLLDKLGYIAEQNQQLMQQQIAPRNQVWTEQDAQGNWWRCEAASRQACWDDNGWERQ